MPKIDDRHPLYAARLPQWERIRHFVEGADALRDHDLGIDGDEDRAYLPRLSPRQERKEYQAYVRRALYENRVARTLDGFLGLMFAKGAAIEVPVGAQALLDDADLASSPFTELLEDIATEMLMLSRTGVLVDYPPASPASSRLDEERAGVRPYFVHYKTEQIINWSHTRIGTRSILSRVVLAESVASDDGKITLQYRELVLTPEGYAQRLWVKPKEASDYTVVSEQYPLMGGSPLEFIPFFFYTPRGSRPEPEKPLLIDLVEVARSHYQSSADLEHSRFACSVPTPYFIGFSAEEVKEIVLGGHNGIHSTSDTAQVGYLEYTGQGTEPLERALKAKAETMAKLGSRMLSEDKREAETAEAMRIRASGESATLADVSRSLSRTASAMLTFAGTWLGVNGVYKVDLPTEFAAPGVDPAELAVLLDALQAGELAPSVFTRRLRDVGIISADISDEELEAEMEAARSRAEERDAAALEAAAARSVGGGEA